jgi:hypothetical protein
MENNANDVLKHSRLGIASFVISLIAGFIEFLVIISAGVLEVEGQMTETSAAAVVIGMLIMLGMFSNLVGVGLGIAAVVQKNAKKLFGVLGLIFNGCLILLIIGLMLIGIMVS